MYLTSKQIDALLAAMDFISSNSDGADDHEPFEEMNGHLQDIWEKAKRERYKIVFRRELKKALSKNKLKFTK